jgi:hypothetical protein
MKTASAMMAGRQLALLILFISFKVPASGSQQIADLYILYIYYNYILYIYYTHICVDYSPIAIAWGC